MNSFVRLPCKACKAFANLSILIESYTANSIGLFFKFCPIYLMTFKLFNDNSSKAKVHLYFMKKSGYCFTAALTASIVNRI
ncbi:hypothetical protein FGO68_gene9064 [Halteria grandinella]|uniref:Uncharacterized protein n=1 Tax=Halteria grandinella TaxID=5974 RepID=A0A8J8NXH8_HALGN|nr:hypothetical protein FGO68_gene9064 [Halteria grandinella]